ncbi:MAG: DNA-processing protein DprA, partial [Veillonella sp.]|nr:DNA-processing protein DprA [Veillonella sp.]
MTNPICEAAYISALLEIPDLGLESCRRLLERFSSPHEAWQKLILDGQLRVLEEINPKLIANLSRSHLGGLPESIQAAMDDCSINGLTYLDDAYPQQLLSIYKPPLVLFYRGDISLASQARMIAMVGARKSSTYGRNVASYL